MRWMLLALSILLTASAAAAQDSVMVDLGMDAAMAGEQASLSVIVSTSGTPEIGALHVDVGMPPKITFVKVAKGQGAEAAGADVKTAVAKAADAAGGSVLTVDVTAPKTIKQGPLLNLIFEVAKDQPGDSEVKLKAVKVTAAAPGGKELVTKAIDGTITVLSPNSDAFACFFYMH